MSFFLYRCFSHNMAIFQQASAAELSAFYSPLNFCCLCRSSRLPHSCPFGVKGGNESPSESSLQEFLCISQQFCWLLTLVFWPSLPFSWCFLCIYIYSGSISISISISLPIIYLCVCLSPFNLLSQSNLCYKNNSLGDVLILFLSSIP